MKRCMWYSSAAMVSVIAAMGAALAQSNPPVNFPTKPIRWIVPFPPGGSVDVLARLAGPRLSEAFGQQVILDNRTGASGIIGTVAVARSAPDGYTLLSNTLPFVANPALHIKPPYDVLKDFAAIATISTGRSVLVVHPSLPAKNLMDIVRLARARPGEVTHATSGNGSVPHLMMELLRVTAPRFEVSHVSYKGNAHAINDLLGGHVTMHISSMLSATPFVKSGRLRPIGVTSGQRTRSMPTCSSF